MVTGASIERSKRPLRSVKFLDFFEMKIITNSLVPGESKDINDCTVFALYEYFASEGQIDDLKKSYKDGISWGDAKEILFELILSLIHI